MSKNIWDFLLLCKQQISLKLAMSSAENFNKKSN
jgi:hypothetical protein